MGEVRVGPTVTRYTFKPERGISVSRLRPLQDDLALNLAMHPVRMEVPVPGQSWVGLEVPNHRKARVSLGEVLKSSAFKNSAGSLTLPLGLDIAGDVWVADLAQMPHLLVAGATGSGKSVGLHSFILSLMYQNSPENLKFILIDVKQVELSKYDKLPYLIAPVVTDSQRAIRALAWSVAEMEKRLGILKEAKCQHISEYNRKQKKKMPYLVIVVDELGDLLFTAKREAEAAIIRLGQKARAAGIHLLLATQRPSVDVVSGLIKANLPARLAYSVTSTGNSKTILDFAGAEKLLGQGDLLYWNPALSKPVRIQGAFVSKQEIGRVGAYIKRHSGSTRIEDDILGSAQARLDLKTDVYDNDNNDLKKQAVDLIGRYRKASATMLQSRLNIGYPRANRLLDELEQEGLVGPSRQNKPQEVYI
jgi:S-DNA-T family DNA segregation ATPase FtsK/SpoIIIE